jgi:hypothetical protein
VTNRLVGWWTFAERVCSRLTTSDVSSQTADRSAERLLRDSWLWSGGGRIVSYVQAAWRDSFSRSLTRAVVTDWRGAGPGIALRAIGWTMTIAAITAVIVQIVGAATVERLTLAMPILLAICGFAMDQIGRHQAPAGSEKR